jgi:hypothetical protein
MNFRRTNAGISNLYLFLGVDAIVFVEGGDTSYSLAELEKGLFNDQAEDLKYWEIIFRTFEPAKTFHLRAVGSKNSLLELADLVSSAKIKRVLVAMDRDFQNLTGELKTGPGVIYTSGYS